MRIRTRLNHSCTVQQIGTIKTGEDDYGRPTYGNPSPLLNVPCRFEKRTVTSYDENGVNRNDEITLMFLPDSGVVDTAIVSNVKDAKGNILHAGNLEVEFVSLGMGRETVDFIQATMKED